MGKENIEKLKEDFDSLLKKILVQIGIFHEEKHWKDVEEVVEEYLKICSARDEIIKKFLE